MKKVLAIFLSSLFLTGCVSYFKRKKCEDVNWQQYGYELAMKGQRPGGDSYVAECRQLGAEMNESQLDLGFKSGMEAYCKPDQAFQTGKKGMTINLDFCDSNLAKLLRQKHSDGVSVYCSPDSAYAEGSSGRSYTGICPKEKEEVFNKEYRRGRKKYVQVTIVQLQEQVTDSDRKISELRRNNEQLALRLAYLPQPQTIIQRTYDPITKTYHDTTSTHDPRSYERGVIQNELSANQEKIRTAEKEQSNLKSEIAKYQKELIGLD